MSTLQMLRSELGELIGKYAGQVDGRDFRKMVSELADEVFGFDDPTDDEIEALQKAFSQCSKR